MSLAPVNPFRGLQSFGPEDFGTLFGRDPDFIMMKGRIFASRTTLMFGGSGVGKTSFFLAKLIPELHRRHAQSLVVRYHREWTSDDPLADVNRSLGMQHGTLQEFFATQPTQSVLILDQFEELFQNPDFWNRSFRLREQLAAVVNSTLQVRVVISMREEFLGNLSFFDNRIPDLFANTYRLKNPDLRTAADIIIATCGRVGVDKNGLSTLIGHLSQVEIPMAGRQTRFVTSDSVFLPYLQLVCRRLWEAQVEGVDGKSSFMFLSDYSELSRSLGNATTPAATALEEFCDGHLDGLRWRERGMAAKALEFLVTSQGAKRAYSTNDLASHTHTNTKRLESFLGKLHSWGILRSWSRQNERWHELYHDMYAPILYRWKERYVTKRRTAVGIFVLVALIVAAVSTGFALNRSQHLKDEEKALALDERAAFAELQENTDEAVMLRLAALLASPSNNRRQAVGANAINFQQRVATFRHDSPIIAVAMTRDDEFAVTASAAVLRDARGDNRPAPLAGGDSGPAEQGTVQVWKTETGEPVGNAITLPVRPIRIAMSGDCSRIAVVSRTAGHQVLWLFNAAQARESKTLLLDDNATGIDAVNALEFNVSGDRLFVASTREWRILDERLQTLKAERSAAVELSPDGGMVLTANGLGAIQLWDTFSARPIGRPIYHQRPVRRLSFRPDSRAFASAGGDQTVRIWDVATGRLLGNPLEHSADVRRLAFSNDGSQLLTLVDIRSGTSALPSRSAMWP